MIGRIHSSRRNRRSVHVTPSAETRLASYPPPYPDGWYRLATSSDLRAGELRSIECLGRQLVLWRSESGDQVHAMTAVCPHLGANLAHGRVKGDHIECPFHAWQLNGAGRVACIPYSSGPPRRVLNETFPIREVDGQIFIYHRGSGAPSRFDDETPYELPHIAELDDGRFVHRGHHDAGRVKMHIIEFAENSADFAHFAPIHGQMRIPWTQIRVPGISIEHTAGWELDAERPHVSYFLDSAVLWILGRRVERAGAKAHITFTGPGSVVNFRFTIPDVGEIEMIQTHLPVGPLEQQVDFHWFADRRVPRLLVSYVVGEWVSQWSRDIEIWENKVYLPKPMLCKDDGPVQRMRRWYEQFYPEDRSGSGSGPEATSVLASAAGSR